jgi:phenylacetate-coenzyme A ligase PaaK-like adenylate-forming protein
MPLVRYRAGDLVERREQPYATNYFVHGRSRDTLRCRDGRRVTTLDIDRCFADANGIAHYQLRQMENGDCHLQFIPENNSPTAEELNRVTTEIENLLQFQNKIVTESVKMLPPLTSGKFRLTSRV